MSSKKCKKESLLSNKCETPCPQGGAAGTLWRAGCEQRKFHSDCAPSCLPAGRKGHLPVSGGRSFWILSCCRLHDIIGTEPSALDYLSNRCIHSK